MGLCKKFQLFSPFQFKSFNALLEIIFRDYINALKVVCEGYKNSNTLTKKARNMTSKNVLGAYKSQK